MRKFFGPMGSVTRLNVDSEVLKGNIFGDPTTRAVDIYLPGCPPRPEMLFNAILKLHEQIQHMPLGVNREQAIAAAEQAALQSTPTIELKGLLR